MTQIEKTQTYIFAYCNQGNKKLYLKKFIHYLKFFKSSN